MFKYNQKLGELSKLLSPVTILVIVSTFSLAIGGYVLVNTSNFEYRLVIQLKDWFNFKGEFIRN